MDKGTLVRTIALVITWLNVWLEQLGLTVIPVISDEEIALGLTMVVSVWTWFKNNYITMRGQEQKNVLETKGLE